MEGLFADWVVRFIATDWMCFDLFVFYLIIMRSIWTKIILIVRISAFIIDKRARIKNISIIFIESSLCWEHCIIFRIFFCLFFLVNLSQPIWNWRSDINLLFFNSLCLFKLNIRLGGILDHAKSGLFWDALIF